MLFVVGSTKKLQDEIDKPIVDSEEYKEVPEIYQWHANLIKINRRKCLILMNNQTGLNLTLFGLRKEQFDNLDEVIKGSLNQLLQVLELDPSIMFQMLNAADDIVYTKTTSRQVLGLMNELKYFIEGRTEGLSYTDIDAVEINKKNNDIIFSPLKHQKPYDTFVKFFEEEK